MLLIPADSERTGKFPVTKSYPGLHSFIHHNYDIHLINDDQSRIRLVAVMNDQLSRSINNQ